MRAYSQQPHSSAHPISSCRSRPTGTWPSRTICTMIQTRILDAEEVVLRGHRGHRAVRSTGGSTTEYARSRAARGPVLHTSRLPHAWTLHTDSYAASGAGTANIVEEGTTFCCLRQCIAGVRQHHRAAAATIKGRRRLARQTYTVRSRSGDEAARSHTLLLP